MTRINALQRTAAGRRPSSVLHELTSPAPIAELGAVKPLPWISIPTMNRPAWRALCALLFIFSDLGLARAEPPQSKPPPLTAVELRRAEQLCAGLVGVPIGRIEYARGATKCAQLRPLLPYMADAQGEHADTFGLDGQWVNDFELRGGLHVFLYAYWYRIWESGRETPRNRAPIYVVTVSRKDGKVIFGASSKDSN